MRVINFAASKKQEGVKKYAKAPSLAHFFTDSPEEAQFRFPMAVSLAFGILFATLTTLSVIPVLLGIGLGAMALIGGSESAAETLT